MGELAHVESKRIEQTEGLEILDRSARRLLGISGEDFIARWEAGDTDGLDHVAVMKVAMLIPLAG